jgi:hypothetical protein
VVEAPGRMDGRNMVMVLAPALKPGGSKQEASGKPSGPAPGGAEPGRVERPRGSGGEKKAG